MGKYYDGPAFFRNSKYSQDNWKLKKNKKKREELKAKKEKAQGNPFKKDLLPKDSSDFVPHREKGVDLENNPLARIVANFHPRHLYLRNGKRIDNYNRDFTFRKSVGDSDRKENRGDNESSLISNSNKVAKENDFSIQRSSGSKSSMSLDSVSDSNDTALSSVPKNSESNSKSNLRIARSETVKNSSESKNEPSEPSHGSMPKLKKPKKEASEDLFTIMKRKKQISQKKEQKQQSQTPYIPSDNKPTPKELNEDTKSNNNTPNASMPKSNPTHFNVPSIHKVYSNYKFPNYNSLVAPQMDTQDKKSMNDWILQKAEVLNKTLKAFKVQGTVVDWTNGPTVTQFQVKLQLGVKVSKLRHLSDDLKMALAAKDIRIEAPIPGKTTCGIEIPNPKPRPVMLSEVLDSKVFRQAKSPLTIALGVDLSGHPRITNLGKMPHGLIAGATGSGKSVFINCMLMSLLYKSTPDQLRMILIDPKAVEFAPYNGLPHLITPVISEPKQAAAALKWVVKVMNQRYLDLASCGVRNIEQYNTKMEKQGKLESKMPYILIVIDELADLMMVAGDEIETYIVRITQKARAAGIHLIVATQRPSVDVITGTMKNNIPTRVAFMVSSQVDSRTILDVSGAEKLLGKGDMLYRGSGDSHPIRLQGCFVSEKEINKVVGQVKHQASADYDFQPGHLLHKARQLANQDKLMPRVLKYIAGRKTVSVSELQRVFSIGYNRSAKIIDDLQKHNYVSEQHGSKPRDVYLTKKDYQKMNL